MKEIMDLRWVWVLTEDKGTDRINGLAAAGYCDRLAVRRLLADLRGQPGCERIQERSLNNYLAGRSRMPPAVEKGLDALIERGSKQ